jgi:hypothetical protein
MRNLCWEVSSANNPCASRFEFNLTLQFSPIGIRDADRPGQVLGSGAGAVARRGPQPRFQLPPHQ